MMIAMMMVMTLVVAISYIVDPFFAIDYPFLLHCGIEKGPNLVVFQSHNASEKDQWQKMDQQFTVKWGNFGNQGNFGQ